MGEGKRPKAELILAIEQVAQDVLNKKVQKAVCIAFEEKGLNQNIPMSIFNQAQMVSQLDDVELMIFADACYLITKEEKFSLKRYFADTKINEYTTYKYEEEKINTMHFKLFKKLSEKNYRGSISYKDLFLYFKNELIIYNVHAQRGSTAKAIGTGEQFVRSITVKKEGVKEIAQLILDGKFEEVEIILNCRLVPKKSPNFNFESIEKYPNIGDIYFTPNLDKDADDNGMCEIIDGYHKSLGIIEAVRIQLEKDGTWLQGEIGVKLVRVDLNRSKAIVQQIFKRSDNDAKAQAGLNIDNPYMQFVEELEANSSTLRGNVGTTIEDAWVDKKYTYKVILVDMARKINIEVEQLADRMDNAERIAVFIDKLVQIIKAKNLNFDEMNKFPNIYAGFVALGYYLKDEQLKFSDYEKILVMIKSNLDEKYNDRSVKKINLNVKNYSIVAIAELFKNIAEEVIKNEQ